MATENQDIKTPAEPTPTPHKHRQHKIVSVSPHIHDSTSVNSVMWNVVVALMPALLAGIIFFGYNAIFLTFYSVIAACLTEAAIQYLRKKPITIHDGSAVVTGILVGFNVHAGVPWWLPMLGSVFAIAVGKHAFGGLGNNIVNPALIGRAFLVASWPSKMTSGWVSANGGSFNGIIERLQAGLPEQITSATPLAALKTLKSPTFLEYLADNGGQNVQDIFIKLTDFSTLLNLFWGNIAGCIGEVSVAALLLGAMYLLYKNIVEWRIPFFYIATVFVLTYFWGGIGGSLSFSVPLFHVLSGGLMLGAFFMATDLVTSPVTKKGRIIFAIGCGVLTTTIRVVGGLPEGVTYSILIMNLFVPLIDKYTFPTPFGEVRK